jgi:hypothetical protein
MTQTTQQTPGWGPPPTTPPPKPKRHLGRKVSATIGALLVAGVIISALNSGGSSQTGTASQPSSGISQGLGSADASGDVSIDSHTYDFSDGMATGTITVVNHSSKRSDYYVEMTFFDASGANVGMGNALVSNVDPAQTAHATVTGTYTGTVDRIKITQVQRTASV